MMDDTHTLLLHAHDDLYNGGEGICIADE